MTFTRRSFAAPLCAALAILGMPYLVHAETDKRAYQQTNLVSDGAVSAAKIDGKLKNPWGIAAAPGGAFWFSDNATGLSTLYDGLGDIIPLVVTIPAPKGSPSNTIAAPSGIVWNPSAQNFLVAPQQAAIFIFVTEDGTLSAWNPVVNLKEAVLEVDNSAGGSGAVYKGLALATNAKGLFLYATNFRAGTIDVFDSAFQPAKLAGSFYDPWLPTGYAPFGIAVVDGNLIVTYALQDAARHDDVKGAGHGFVDVFDTDGHLIRRLASRGALNSPWGIARAPWDFGPASTRLLIGNFGDGRINSFTSEGEFRGELRTPKGTAVQIPGLWGITFGTEAAADPNRLYFTAGPRDENDGLFGSLSVVNSEETLSDSP
jgi:uncharacterized protein (TIGR03118 family)